MISQPVSYIIFGSNSSNGGPFRFINIKSAIVLTWSKLRMSVSIRFIWLKPRSHSDVPTGIVFKIFNKGFKSVGIFRPSFSKNSRKELSVLTKSKLYRSLKIVISLVPNIGWEVSIDECQIFESRTRKLLINSLYSLLFASCFDLDESLVNAVAFKRVYICSESLTINFHSRFWCSAYFVARAWFWISCDSGFHHFYPVSFLFTIFVGVWAKRRNTANCTVNGWVCSEYIGFPILQKKGKSWKLIKDVVQHNYSMCQTKN